MFKLEKLQLDHDKDSMVPAGYSQEGESLKLFKYDTEESKSLSRLSDVEVVEFSAYKEGGK